MMVWWLGNDVLGRRSWRGGWERMLEWRGGGGGAQQVVMLCIYERVWCGRGKEVSAVVGSGSGGDGW